MLPGEAEPIDRIVEKFAEKYYLDNNTDTTYFGMYCFFYMLSCMILTNPPVFFFDREC